MTIPRRDALKYVAGACLAGMAPALSAREAGPQKKKKKIPIGLQIYAVRGAFQKDVPGTLKKVAQLGYQGVEFWGYNGGDAVFKGYSAGALRKLLDANGLKCCGMHLGVKALVGATFDKTVAINKTLGNKFLIVAAAKAQMSSVDAIKAFADLLNKAAKRAKAAGMRVGYHCHGFDFKKFEGKTAWELLFSQTAPDVVMQLDVGNCAGGGGDPLAMLKKFPKRATTLHVKEFKDGTLQKGHALWEKILTNCEKRQGTQWYIVEVGGPGGMSLEEPARCLKALKQMGR